MGFATTLHAATPSACQLLNSQAASSLLGSPANPPMDGGGVVCIYSDKGASKTLSLNIQSATFRASDFETQTRMQGFGATNSEVVPGVGEANKLLFFSGDHSALMVLYHGELLTLGVMRMKMTPDLKTAMIQTMKQILGKI